MTDDATVVLFKPKKCPLCAKPVQKQHRPFCSKRCADLDLGAWLNESYRISSEEEGAVEDEFSDEN